MRNLLGVGILKTRETYTAVVVNGNRSQLVMLSGILQQGGLQVTSYENAPISDEREQLARQLVQSQKWKRRDG